MASLSVSRVSIHFIVVFASFLREAPGYIAIPQKTFRRWSLSWKINSVTTPKFPPPPRTPQNRSAFSFAFAVSISHWAVTIVTCSKNYDRGVVRTTYSIRHTCSRLSMDKPSLPVSQPYPPPSVCLHMSVRFMWSDEKNAMHPPTNTSLRRTH